MKYVGAHVSMAGGIYNSVLNAKRIGAKSFALFTKNQKQWVGKPITHEDVERFSSELKAAGYSADSVLPHDSYLINLGHPDMDKLQKSREAFQDEMKRCMLLGLKMLNFHPGSHLGMISVDKCLTTISDSINYALENSDNVTAVIENTAGQGNTVGNKFEHLMQIIDGVEDKERVGVCIDTCHAFAAGYDLRSKETYENVWDQFSQIVGFEYLKAMHINDSKKEFNSRVDRHASLGKGEIGINCFKYIMNDSRMEEIPLILETPDSDVWQQEIKMLYDFYRDEK